ncbi:hypothetical protein PoB_000631500 [Plakobranchus ocellatus]|uniref:Uncharacterized protein n=1 Tax=Plakobranchus ocellatus TaxID=259542 RepID=A0AAV3YBD4_9GAST|nr:hypothetical protein PoB_000631500 [Plakobranchus ocellatus]
MKGKGWVDERCTVTDRVSHDMYSVQYASPRHDGLRLLDLPTAQGASGWSRIRVRRFPADLRAMISTMPPTPPTD